MSHKRLRNLLTLAVIGGSFQLSALANVKTKVPEENGGPPAYSQVQAVTGTPGYFIPHTREWAAIPFIRETSCVPPDFNLLEFNDFTPAFPGGPPRPFTCPLTVEGFAIWKNGPPPVDFVPILSQLHGLGSVPVWLVRFSELETMVEDGDLTLSELLAAESLLIGYAEFYKETVHPGTNRPQGEGNGKIEISAWGWLEDGRFFQLQVREIGDDGDSLLRHVKIHVR